MNNYPSRYADEIKARVPLLDLLAAYGFHPSYNRMACPFHNGQDRNMLVSNNIYKCFVCGASGDIFTFVQNYFGLDFPSAKAKINDDFNLGFPIGKEVSRAEREEANRREAERRQKAEQKKRRLEALQAAYDAAFDEFTSCDIILLRCAPLTPTSGLTDAFCWAAKNIERAKYELAEAEAALFRFREQERKENAQSGQKVL